MELFPTRVLAAVDRSDSARTAATVAAQLAGASGSELWLVHVKLLSRSLVGSPGNDPRYAQLEAEGREVLEAVRAEVEAESGVDVAQVVVRLGQRIEQSVAALAEEIGAGLIVCGGTTRGALNRTVGGDVAVGLVRSTPCSVLVVPPHVAGVDQAEAAAIDAAV
jgi:nucleotide-binding universal stress UspA family protein